MICLPLTKFAEPRTITDTWVLPPKNHKLPDNPPNLNAARATTADIVCRWLSGHLSKKQHDDASRGLLQEVCSYQEVVRKNRLKQDKRKRGGHASPMSPPNTCLQRNFLPIRYSFKSLHIDGTIRTSTVLYYCHELPCLAFGPTIDQLIGSC